MLGFATIHGGCMKRCYVFPGQGAQFVGMGKDLYDGHPEAKELFDAASDFAGYSVPDLIFSGTED